MNTVIMIVLLIIVALTIILLTSKPAGETFYNDLSSSAFGLNNGPIWGDTGYGFFGEWSGNIPTVPWKNWMFSARRPDFFYAPFTPAPQIDYNAAPDVVSNPVTNYSVTLLPVDGKLMFALNGVPAQTLQLDKNRTYFFHVYTPGVRFAINDAQRDLSVPVDNGTLWVKFKEDSPKQLFYYSPDRQGMDGLIYLNPIQGNNDKELNSIQTFPF